MGKIAFLWCITLKVGLYEKLGFLFLKFIHFQYLRVMLWSFVITHRVGKTEAYV